MTRCLDAGSKCCSAPKCFPPLCVCVWGGNPPSGGLETPFFSFPSSIRLHHKGVLSPGCFYHCAQSTLLSDLALSFSLPCTHKVKPLPTICVFLCGPPWPLRCSHKRPKSDTLRSLRGRSRQSTRTMSSHCSTSVARSVPQPETTSPHGPVPYPPWTAEALGLPSLLIKL